MNLTREQVQAYLELEKKATPGGWFWVQGSLESSSLDNQWTGFRVLETNRNWITDGDAQFIAESRTIAPQLAEAYLQALDVIEKIREAYQTESSAEVQAWAMDELARQFLQERSESK